ncbi:MAG: hypothetical protein LBI91_03915 [Spirochaetaceae bacterium]|nr:hypothetical protein [Spirochaetaceae bacterium]
MVITVSITVLMVISLKNIVWFFVTIKRSFDKFNSLDARARNKILLLDYYMVFARNFSKNDLVSLGLLNDEEIKKINGIPEYGERIQAARGIITSMKG